MEEIFIVFEKQSRYEYNDEGYDEVGSEDVVQEVWASREGAIAALMAHVTPPRFKGS